MFPPLPQDGVDDFVPARYANGSPELLLCSVVGFSFTTESRDGDRTGERGVPVEDPDPPAALNISRKGDASFTVSRNRQSSALWVKNGRC